MTNPGILTWRSAMALVLALALCLAASGVQALEQKGVGEVDYGRRLKSDEKREAVHAAMRNAVQTWVAEKQSSHYRNYEQVKDTIDNNIEDYVLSHQVISEDTDKPRYRVVLRATLNEPKLLDALLSPSGQQASGEDQYITMVFVAREAVGTVTATEKEATKSRTRRRGIAKERAEDSAGQSRSESQTIAMRKTERNFSDVVLWDVSTSNEVNVAMGDVFTEARYLIVDAALVEEDTQFKLNTQNFIDEYGRGDDVTPATKRDAMKGLMSLRGTDGEVHYLAVGTLDVGRGALDEATGNYRVDVSVTGEILSVFQRGAAVAKVGPEVTYGEGPTVLIAKNNALKAAARQAASQLVAKLSARNIR